ncbi:MAG: Gfo/Idh/MocA family oxidoreductase [Verrucomicrobiota bacterium]|jgi:predicted dehydrogenase|nr:Gfo/Idh/MocA family oxidoreductase [Verrucomicrobiota bacterium]
MMQFNRRDFIKSGAYAAGALAMGGCATAAAPRSIRVTEGKLNIGVIGVGGKGWSDWNPMLDYGENIAALCDADSGQIKRGLEEIAKKRGAEAAAKVKTYTDWRKLVAEIETLGINAVTVSTPDHTHAPAAISAMRLGCHAYVQKPLVRTIGEARWFERAAKEFGVVTQMGNQGSANSGLRRNVEVLQKGVLGNITEVHVWTNRPVWPQGKGRPEGSDPLPENLDWDSWIGAAPLRPYKKDTYHTFKWRGFLDFGTGAFGDMACHTMNVPFRGLQLQDVVSAECTKIIDPSDDMYPSQSIVELVYAARTGLDGRKLPAVKLFWYDGNQQKNDTTGFNDRMKELMPQIVTTLGQVPNTGCLIVGDKGIMASVNDYGAEAYIALKGEEKAKSVSKHEATSVEAIPEFIPRAEKGDNYREFVDACKGKVKAYADIDHSVPMLEAMLVGCISQRLPGTKLAWNSRKQSFGNKDADALVYPHIRQGWGGWEYKK